MTEVEIESREKVKRLLKQLFQFDMQDLDFGIYRIMNFKRKEIEKFIEEDLIKAAEEEFREYAQVGMVDLQKEIEKLRAEIIRDFGEGTIDEQGNVKKHDDAPKIQEYLSKMKELGDAKLTQAQIDDVFNHIYEFFSRYYDKGDFVSKKLYRGREKYYVPYNGDEVLFHWANNDQYYAKSGEYFKKYSFQTGGFQVNFVLKEAEAELNNVKEARRYFLLCEDDAFELDDEKKELNLFLNWRTLVDVEKKKYGTRNVQEKIVSDVVKKLLSQIGDKGPGTELRRMKEEESILEKHLKKYVEKNTTDYFIHKNLKMFLERELEFYLKNEVLDLDEIEQMDERNIRINKAKIRAIRAISEKIIDFLSQIENFQKMLFEKKKFVLRTDYCMTLDLVPEEFYKEIGENEKQVAEWKELFKLDQMTMDTLQKTQGMKKLDADFLKLYKQLVLDTSHFSEDFKWRLLASFDYLDEVIDGILIKSENFQALTLLSNKYKARVKCIYIDPPFNTGGSEFLYKNEFRHSSWCSMMWNVLKQSKPYLEPDGVLITTIDDFELYKLGFMLDGLFGEDGKLGVLVVRSKPSGRTTDKFLAVCHEYYLFYSNSQNVEISFFELTEEQKKAYQYKDDVSYYKWRDFLRTGGYSTPEERPNSFYPIYYNKETGQLSLGKQPGSVEISPIDSSGRKRVWRKTPPSFLQHVKNGEIMVKEIQPGSFKVYIKDRIKVGVRPKSIWTGAKYDASSHGTKLLDSMFTAKVPFDYPKSVCAVEDAVKCIVGNDENALIFDFFAGSGTTAQAVINLNRRYNSKRKYIMVEMGPWFDTVLIPRIKKAVFCETWKDGQPASKNGLSHMFKYMYLEQYEDTLNNITFRAMDKTIQETLDSYKDYFLRFMLDYETRESPTRLLVDKFNTPFDYKIKTISGNQEKEEIVSLVETFNYLLGLDVERLRAFKDCERTYRVVIGKRNNKSIVVIWRNMKDLDLEKDKKFIEEKVLSGKAYDLIFINGDSYVKDARAIEPEFKKLMGA